VKREYGQHCWVAKALDVIGGRWTLLVVRELMPGPRRYKDLLAGLPGIGTNLLTDRLRHLESEGLIERRTLPPPAGSTVYELTEEGRRLEAIVFDLSRWGRGRMQRRDPSDYFNPRWAALAMKSVHSAEAAAGVSETYEFRIGDEVFSVVVDEGEVVVFDGPATEPDAVITADLETFFALGDGPEALDQALTDGRMRVEGDPDAVRHCREIFAPTLTVLTAS
jgi:DNA-binding HxlR family transcriptional regulator/putative sterol carrier protein